MSVSAIKNSIAYLHLHHVFIQLPYNLPRPPNCASIVRLSAAAAPISLPPFPSTNLSHNNSNYNMARPESPPPLRCLQGCPAHGDAKKLWYIVNYICPAFKHHCGLIHLPVAGERGGQAHGHESTLPREAPRQRQQLCLAHANNNFWLKMNF